MMKKKSAKKVQIKTGGGRCKTDKCLVKEISEQWLEKEDRAGVI